MSDDKRRASDSEDAFRIRIVEQLAEIKGDVKEIKASSADHGVKIMNVESALWGYPKGDGIGLLERHRVMKRNWAIIVAVCAFAFSALGKIVSPLYDKWVSDWAFNSPSQKWLRESQRPKRTVYKIYQKPEPAKENAK